MGRLNRNETIVLMISIVVLITTFVLGVFVDGVGSSKLETAFLSLFQFGSSIGITFLVSKASIKKEYIDSQKQFAGSSYRRIVDIKRNVEILEKNIKKERDTRNLDDLIVSVELLMITIESSMIDWKEIIGKEIDLVQEKKMLENELGRLYITKDEFDEYEKRYAKLQNDYNQLPSTMKDKDESKSVAYYKDFRRIMDRLLNHQKIQFKGQVQHNGGLNFRKLKKGDILLIGGHSRSKLLDVSNQNNEYIGSYINTYSLAYSDSSSMIEKLTDMEGIGFKFIGDLPDVNDGEGISKNLFQFEMYLENTN